MLLAVIFVAIGVAIGSVFWLYNSDLERARKSAGRGSQVANTTVGPIEYAETGVGFPLLSIHGAGGGFDQGLANVRDFIDGGFREIAPSRFGYLRTPAPPDASVTAQADAHAALLSALNVPKAVVVGVSAGARSAVELAIRHPGRVSALILVVPGTFSPDSPVSLPAGHGSGFLLWLVNVGADFAWWAAQKIAPSMLVRFAGVPPKLLTASAKPERARVKAIVEAIEPLSLRFRGIALDSVADANPPRFSAIVAPTLVISAHDDLFNTAPAARFAARMIPSARLIVFDTGGHLLVGRAREVREAVRAHLAPLGLMSPAGLSLVQ